jgi:SAM-dependent methyltransferase
MMSCKLDLMIGRLKSVLRPFRLYRAAGFAYNFVRDPVFRRGQWLRWKNPPGLFQSNPLTVPDRYPGIFRFVSMHLGAQRNPRLLSFGCSFGEEVFTLRRYFPVASIKGVDINPANIAACRARHEREGRDRAIEFECKNSAVGERPDSYDAVFCMAVFQRATLKEDRTIASCEPHLRFADFARTVAGLAACVKPGGYLVIRYSMFRFAETECARDFRAVLSRPAPSEFFPRFDSDNRRLSDAAEEEVVFQKHNCSPALPEASQ